MTSYEFQSTLFQTSRQMHAAIAESYMTAGGNNDAEDIRRFFKDQTDEQLAADAINGWDLYDNPDFDRAELIHALADLRSVV